MMEMIQEYYYEINTFKLKLASSDYKILKYLEGELSEDEYKSICKSRKEWREKINELQATIKELSNK